MLRSPRSVDPWLGDLWLAQTLGERCRDSRYDHLALTVAEVDLDACVAILTDLGARVWQPNSSEGRSFDFEDPAGHRRELHAGTLAERVQARRDRPDGQRFPAADHLLAGLDEGVRSGQDKLVGGRTGWRAGQRQGEESHGRTLYRDP